MQFQNEPEETPGLDTYLRAITRRPWLIAMAVIGSVLLGLLFLAVRSDVYTASNRVLVGPTPYGRTRPNELVVPSLQREREVLSSVEVAERVQTRLGTTEEPSDLLAGLDVIFQPESDTLRVSYTDGSPVRAAELANAFSEAYVQLRADQVTQYYQSQIAAVDARLDEIGTVLTDLGNQINALSVERANLSTTLNATEIATIDNTLVTLRSEQGQYTNEQRSLLTNRAALLAEQSVPAPAARLLSTAAVPGSPNGMGSSLVLLLALIAGGGLGLTAAFVADRLDTRIYDRFALERALGTPALASLPSLGLRVRLSGNSLVMTSEGTSPTTHVAKEGFRRLRSSLLFIKSRQDANLFLFTSAHPAEGKSTVVANTAVALANSGRSVALVSGDLRRPRIESLFDLQPAVGLTEILQGDDEVVLQPTHVPNLLVLPAGGFSGHNSELLTSDRMKELLTFLQDQYDMVLVDTPPMLATADVGTIAGFGGSVVIVVDAKNTSLEDLALVRTELDRVGAVVAGSVLNRDPTQRTSRFALWRTGGGYYADQPATARVAGIDG